MSATLEHTTVEHPTPEQAPPPYRWKRGAGVVALVLGLGTIIVIDLIQQGPADVPQETFSPETHRDWTPPRTETSSTPQPGTNQLRVEATQGDPDSQQAVIAGMIAEGFYGLSPASAQAVDTDGHYPGLYAADELATMRLDREGHLPKELLETRRFVTKRLVNEGRIPAATVR